MYVAFVFSLQVGHSFVKTQASVAVALPCKLDIPAEKIKSILLLFRSYISLLLITYGIYCINKAVFP